MKKVLLVPVLLVTLTLGWALAAARGASAVDDSSDNAIVGVWEVAADAPYSPHLFTFHADGTMTSTNPTNVQERQAAPHGGTNDSLGMGAWKTEVENGTKYFVGSFEELNAFADNHQPTDTLKVSFKVQLTNNGQGFDGPAIVHQGSDVIPSHVTGTQRVVVDQAAVDSL
ncbi:MAG TPA: hypothetical protein VL737_04390 [Candidatus Pristimantibacillus sp.]|nr:hypothetical protein [Candidatus Pristimantibacillus sp.]